MNDIPRDDDTRSGRRSFLTALAAGLAGLVTLGTAAVAAAYFGGPALRRPKTAGVGERWLPVPGASPDASRVPTEHTVQVVEDAGWARTASQGSFYVDMAEDGSPRALSARCPHQGCHVNWKPELGQYACPCHASFWERDGTLLGGPAKRGLDPLPVRVSASGVVEVDYRTFVLDTADRVEVG
jgi:menaquinol-cytochrome c reductase iron-sulfur subunit